MYTFRLKYVGDHFFDYYHIEKAEYFSAVDIETISDDEILTHKFPDLTDIHLIANNESYFVSGKDLVSIETTKEPS
jgi:hypothetical protein